MILFQYQPSSAACCLGNRSGIAKCGRHQCQRRGGQRRGRGRQIFGGIRRPKRPWKSDAKAYPLSAEESVTILYGAQLLRHSGAVSKKEFFHGHGIWTMSFFRLPLLPASSKVNKNALPPVDRVRDVIEPEALPSTPTEVALAKLWADVLGLCTVDVNDSFFDLGG